MYNFLEFTLLFFVLLPRHVVAELYQVTKVIALEPLAPGEILLTDAQNTILEMPVSGKEGGQVAIKSFRAELLTSSEEDGILYSVPLSHLYNHHWIATDLNLPKLNSDIQVFEKFVQDNNKRFGASS